MFSLRKKTRHFRHALLYAAAKLFFGIACRIPRRFGLALFGFSGKLAFLVPGSERKRTLEHLRFIYGGKWTDRKIKKTAADVWSNLGKNLFDSIHIPALADEHFFSLVRDGDLSQVRRAYARNRGLIVITGHIGCFELLLHFFARAGMRSFAVGRNMPDKRIDRMVRSIRSGPNIEYIARSENARKILRFLEEGRVFGALIDQDTSVDGVFAEFLGKPAHTPCGPVRIAMKYKIPVVVAATVRGPDNRHQVMISPELELADTGNFERDLVENVTRANRILCMTIDEYPSQWVWMHRRWRRKPEMDGHESDL